MAVGNQNRQSSGKAFTARIKLKDGTAFLDVPEFEIQAKEGTEYVTLTDEKIKEIFGVDAPVRDFSGDLISIDTRVGEYDGNPIHNVTLSLKDSSRNEVYFVQFIANNNLGRGVANRLLNLKAYENVQIGLYAQHNKETKKSYAACAIRQGDSTDTIKYKYDPKTAAEMQPRIFEGKGGKPEKDWTKVDEFLFDQLGGLGNHLKSNRSTKQEAPQSQTQAPAPAPEPAQDDSEKPPF